MNNGADTGEGIGAALAFLTLWWIIAMLVYWFVCALVAGLIALARDRSFFGFFLATFFFLGPLGIAVAMLAPRGEMDGLPPAPEKRKVAEGRQRFTCPRCGADNDLPNADTSYECWRCGEVRKVKPQAMTASRG